MKMMVEQDQGDKIGPLPIALAILNHYLLDNVTARLLILSF